MQAKVSMLKDVCSISTFLATDIAAVGFWDSGKMTWVNSDEEYFDKFNKIFEESLQEIAESMVVTETNGDGNYKVTLRFNTGLDEYENTLKYRSECGIKFTSTGKLYIGSPEYVGHKEEDATTRNLLDMVELTPGTYIVDAYSLLHKDEQGNPDTIEYIFCIWEEGKYKGDKSALHEVTKALKLKYVKEAAN